MISVTRDDNRIPALLATSMADGKTVMAVKADPVSHKMLVNTIDSANFSHTNAQKDANRVSAIWGTSNVDGVTPIPIYCDANGQLLIQFT